MARRSRASLSLQWFTVAASSLPLGLFSLILSTVRADLPYTPTYILRSSRNNGAYIYILEPPSPAARQGQLLALSASASLNSSSLPTTTVSAALPFLLADPAIAYIPVVDPDGTLVVYAGNCTQGSSDSSIWRYTPEATGTGGMWSKEMFTRTSTLSPNTLPGVNYLGAGAGFSNNTTGTVSQLYIFGGMCPSSMDAPDNWILSATYSDNLLLYKSAQLSSASIEQGQPIAEAGFTFTPLTPQFTNVSQNIIQQQDFLLLGGNTENAFINMSEVALFSVPQEIWSFQSVAPGTNSNIEPRSGHTATLTSDGSQIVVIGGWVGDTSIPATPQLAVLDIGIGYGGIGEWKWTVPTTADTPFESSGLYGHGALLLDEEIIMVTGGYGIPNVSSRTKRATQAGNGASHFYNISSQQWMSSYNPSHLSSSGSGSVNGKSGVLHDHKAQIGLGVGLGVGLLILILAAACAWWYSKRLKRKRAEKREEMVKFANMSNTEYQNYHDEDDDEKAPGLPPAADQADEEDHVVPATSLWSRRQRNKSSWTWLPTEEKPEGSDNGWAVTGARTAERTGLDVDIASPHRGLRRSLNTTSLRANYRASSIYEDEPPSGYGNMYAIEERSEEGSVISSRKTSGKKPKSPLRNSDPFRDPDPDLLASHRHHIVSRKPVRQISHTATVIAPPPTASPDRHQRTLSPWMRDWAEPDALLPHGQHSFPPKSGRSSPSKSIRTSSELSNGSIQRTPQNGISPELAAFPEPRRELSRRSFQYYFPGLLHRFASISSSVSGAEHSRPGTAKSSRPGTGRSNGVPRSRPNSAGTYSGGHFADPPATNYQTPFMNTHTNSNPTSTDTESFTTAHTTVSHLPSEAHSRLISPTITPPTSPAHPQQHLIVDHDISSFVTSLEPDTRPTFTRPSSSHPRRNSRSRSRGSVGGLGFIGSVKRAVGPRSISYGEQRHNRAEAKFGRDTQIPTGSLISPLERHPIQAQNLVGRDFGITTNAIDARRVVSDGASHSTSRRGRTRDIEPLPLTLTRTPPDHIGGDDADAEADTPVTARRIATPPLRPTNPRSTYRDLQSRLLVDPFEDDVHEQHHHAAARRGLGLSYPILTSTHHAPTSIYSSNLQPTHLSGALQTHTYHHQHQHHPFPTPMPATATASTHHSLSVPWEHHPPTSSHRRSTSATSEWGVESDGTSWVEEREGVPITYNSVPRGGLMLRVVSGGVVGVEANEPTDADASVGDGEDVNAGERHEAISRELDGEYANVRREGNGRLGLRLHSDADVQEGDRRKEEQKLQTSTPSPVTTRRGGVRVVGADGEGEWVGNRNRENVGGRRNLNRSGNMTEKERETEALWAGWTGGG